MKKEIINALDYSYKLGANKSMIYNYVRKGQINKMPCVIRFVNSGGKVPLLEVDKEKFYTAITYMRSGGIFCKINEHLIKVASVNKSDDFESLTNRFVGEINGQFSTLEGVKLNHYKTAKRKFENFEKSFTELKSIWEAGLRM